MSIVDDAVAHDVRTYAAQVRAALADLGPDQVDDLTDGLEANLADALADERRAHGGTLVDEFGEPGAYAAELRAAAGLAPASRGEGGVRAAFLSPWRALREIDGAALAHLRTTRWFPGVEDLAVALRPAWWVLRGWALAHLVLQVLAAEPTPSFWLPSTLGGWVLLGLCVVASAQWGRGRWRTGPRWRRPLRLLSGVLAVASVVLLLWLPGAQRDDVSYAQEVLSRPPSDGVVVDGVYVNNLFVYDADGRPVEGAQIFDQVGRPVTTEPDGGVRWKQQEYWPDGADEPRYHVGVPGANGQVRWNVFPLHSLTAGGWAYDDETGTDVVAEHARDQVLAPSWPFASASRVEPWGRTSDDEPSTDDDAAVSDAPSATSSPTAPGATPQGSSGAPVVPDPAGVPDAPAPVPDVVAP